MSADDGCAVTPVIGGDDRGIEGGKMDTGDGAGGFRTADEAIRADLSSGRRTGA